MLGHNDILFECYFDGNLVEYERWTDRGWMYYEPDNEETLYFEKKYAHSHKRPVYFRFGGTIEDQMTDVMNAYAQMAFVAKMTEKEAITNAKHVIQEQYFQSVLNS